ncbi:MAG: hypothetical protein LBT78_04490, partial [Tannerella sp.]|nr:hypothetical protein [Tannerella sp.]
MKIFFCYLLAVAGICSCSRPLVIGTAIEGELYAKNTVKATYRAAVDAEVAFAWYVGDRPAGDWTALPGIHTPEIVLLTDYAGKYLKCEITASKDGKTFPPVAVTGATPVADRGNPDTDWFKEAGLGLMVHFLKGVYTSGSSAEWNGIVDGFDAAL